MNIFVYSRYGLDAARPHEVPHVVLSITSSPDDLPRLRQNPECRGVLRLSFLDAETASDQHAESELFSGEHAKQVWDFEEIVQLRGDRYGDTSGIKWRGLIDRSQALDGRSNGVAMMFQSRVHQLVTRTTNRRSASTVPSAWLCVLEEVRAPRD